MTFDEFWPFYLGEHRRHSLSRPGWFLPGILSPMLDLVAFDPKEEGMKQHEAIQAIIATIPLEIRNSGRVSVITDGVMESMRKLAPEVIYAIVTTHGPSEPERRLQLLEGRGAGRLSRSLGPR